MMAPFTPFITEYIYRELIKIEKDKVEESVHLCDYPKYNSKKISSSLEKRMGSVRVVVASALAQRSRAGIKVRQPLKQLTINNKELSTEKELLELIKKEVNVKEVRFNSKIKDDVVLDIKLNKELREEGFIREAIRQVQDSRKSTGLTKKDKIRIFFSGTLYLENLISRWKETLLSETLALSIEFRNESESFKSKEMVFGKEKARIGIYKI